MEEEASLSCSQSLWRASYIQHRVLHARLMSSAKAAQRTAAAAEACSTNSSEGTYATRHADQPYSDCTYSRQFPLGPVGPGV